MRRLIICFLVLFSVRGFSQQVLTNFTTANSPLPENSVRCIEVDHIGRKWIGTDYGLAVFDDVNWNVYLPFSSGLPAMSVRAIAFDSLNNAWIGTLGGGVAKFDGTNWIVYDNTNSPITENSIRALAFDSAGALWIGNQDGLVKFDGTNWIVYSAASSIIQNTIASIHTSKNRKVYAGSVNGGLFILHEDTIKSNLNISNGSGIPDNTILAFDEDSVGNIWMATPANGIVVYRNIGGWFWYYMGSSFIQSNSLSDIQFSNNHQSVWVATADSGIIRKTGTVYTCFNTVNTAMPDNNIQSLTIDSMNNIWIGTATQGVVKFQDFTGTNNFAPAGNFESYPNPVSDKINFKTEILPFTVEVMDVKGAIVYSETINTNLSSIDVSRLKNGIYSLKAVSKDNVAVIKRFCKQ